VAVAQLVESRIVIPVVVGSNPISHPNSPVLPREHLLTWYNKNSVCIKFDVICRLGALRFTPVLPLR
jgi:hypothetical protein